MVITARQLAKEAAGQARKHVAKQEARQVALLHDKPISPRKKIGRPEKNPMLTTPPQDAVHSEEHQYFDENRMVSPLQPSIHEPARYRQSQHSAPITLYPALLSEQSDAYSSIDPRLLSQQPANERTKQVDATTRVLQRIHTQDGVGDTEQMEDDRMLDNDVVIGSEIDANEGAETDSDDISHAEHEAVNNADATSQREFDL
jgi:hypothetical protein